jgi:hypothetical protein
MSKRPWLIGLMLAALWTGDASAQCQGPGTICAEYEAAAMVFLARVSQVTPIDDRQLGPILLQTVTFEVIEDFKGTAGGSATLTFDPAAPDARVFSTAETVLVYVRTTANRSVWFAGCSRTRRVTPDDAELVTLRQLQNGNRGGSVEGTLLVPANVRPPAVLRHASLENLQLSVQALDGSETFLVSSQASGYFLFPWLRPGAYRIRLEAPELVPVVRDVVIGESAPCRTLDPMAVRPR